MATTIITKHSATAKDPQPSQLERGELAIDLERKNIYTKDASDEVVQLGGRPVKIGSTAPPTPQEGDLWMEVPTTVDEPAMMWVYDGDKWLEHPSGVDGAPGQNGADGNIADATEQGVIATWDDATKQWTPESNVVVDDQGRMGIGTETPGADLEIKNTVSIIRLQSDANDGYGQLSASSGSLYFSADSGNTRPSSAIVFNVDGSQKAIIDSSGNVGIGTESPNTKLDVIGSSTNGSGIVDTLRLRNTGVSPGDGACIQFTSGTSTSGAAIASHGFALNSADLLFYAGGNTERMRIGADGRVDITGSLYVNGTPKIGTVDLIKAFSKLRDAVKDEETVESLKESITNCIGGLIEEWESMQSPATQEIES